MEGDAAEGAGQYLEFNQRLKKIEDSIAQIQRTLGDLQLLCNPLYDIDIDMFFRLFLRLKIRLNADIALTELGRRRDAINIPPVPPPPGIPDALHYHENVARKRQINEAIAYLTASAYKVTGQIEHAQDPMSIAHEWYAEAKAYLEKKHIEDIFEDKPETVFPKHKSTENCV
ncbi:MAG: hypothetical protein JRN22_00450 [Nitrososphaerota archaeon]|nr:hypothetical protein [Nitrososphaerota archaeon]